MGTSTPDPDDHGEAPTAASAARPGLPDRFMSNVVHPLVIGAADALWGPFIAAGLGLGIPNVLARRVDKLIYETAERLGDVEVQLTETLATVTALAIQAATTADDDKIEYLANAIVNTATSDEWTHDSAAMLLRLLRDLTATHLRVLDLLAEPTAWIARHNVVLQEVQVNGRYPWSATLESAFERAGSPIGDVGLILTDLESFGLLDTVGTGDENGGERPPEFTNDVVSPLGKRLRWFITLSAER